MNSKIIVAIGIVIAIGIGVVFSVDYITGTQTEPVSDTGRVIVKNLEESISMRVP